MKAAFFVSIFLISLSPSAQVVPAGVQLRLNDSIHYRIDHYVDSLVTEHRLGSAVVLASVEDTIFHRKAYGWSDREKNISTSENTIFWIASMTKIFVAVSVLMLKDEGFLQFDDPVSKYIPEIKDMKVGVEYLDSITMEKKIRLEDVKVAMTIRHLLANTSGFISAGLYDGPVADQYKLAAMWKYHDLRQLVLEHCKIPLAHQPGEAWGYDFSYNVLAYVIEIVSGKSLEKFFAEKIFAPLGMKDTGYDVKKKDRSRVCQYYYLQNEKLLQDQPQLDEKVTLFHGNSGLWSTADDFFKLCTLILNRGTVGGKRLINTSTVDELFTDVEAGKDGHLLSWLPCYGYGLGFAVRVNDSECGFTGNMGELCWFGVLNTFFWIDPQKKIICIGLTHMVPSGGYEWSKELRNIIYSSLN